MNKLVKTKELYASQPDYLRGIRLGCSYQASGILKGKIRVRCESADAFLNVKHSRRQQEDYS